MSHVRLVLLSMLLAESVFGADTTALPEMLAAVQEDPKLSQNTLPLKRDWIGDIKEENGNVARLRFEKGLIMDGQISILRTYPNGSYVGADAPDYLPVIPTSEQLRLCTSVDQLTKLLGPGHPSFSAWGSPKEMHGSHSWVCFGPAADDAMTYLSVFAYTSWVEERRVNGIEKLNELQIRRGRLRPADPGSLKERELYLSGADMFAAEENEKASARQGYPRPLRDLIKISEHPDDSDLKHLSAAVQSIRNDPDPELFHQLVEEMHEGTLRIRSLLEDVLLNENDLLELKPWEPGQKKIAVNACIDALPLAKTGRATEDLVEIVLKVCGGGRIRVGGDHGGSSVEVTPTETGYNLTLGRASRPLALKDAQQELRRLYARSHTEPAGPGQPTTRRESK